MNNFFNGIEKQELSPMMQVLNWPAIDLWICKAEKNGLGWWLHRFQASQTHLKKIWGWSWGILHLKFYAFFIFRFIYLEIQFICNVLKTLFWGTVIMTLSYHYLLKIHIKISSHCSPSAACVFKVQHIEFSVFFFQLLHASPESYSAQNVIHRKWEVFFTDSVQFFCHWCSGSPNLWSKF